MFPFESFLIAPAKIRIRKKKNLFLRKVGVGEREGVGEISNKKIT